LFIAIKEDGKLWLRDTYWGLGGNDNKKYSYSEANKLGKLSYYCNLKGIKSINEYDLDYYDDKDTFVLHDQHSCVPSCRYYFVKKDAKRSKVKMLEVLNEKLEEAKRNVERETRQVEEYATKKQQVENGKLDIYI